MANNRELSQLGSFVEVSNSTVGVSTNLNVTGIISATNGFVGTITGNADTATALETPRTFQITGDVLASAIIFDGTGNVSLAATIQPNSVALGDDTTGNYVASITNGNYITGGNGGSEGAGLTLNVDATSSNTALKVVARDASGNFSAGTISALGLSVTNNATVGGALTVTGDLTVNGTTTIINSTTISVDDKNIELGSVDTPTDTTADGGGITLKGDSDHTITWSNTNDSWDFSENVNIVTGKEYRINNTSVLNATTLGSGVVNSSLTSFGTVPTATITNLTNTNINSSGIVTAATFSGNLQNTLTMNTSGTGLSGSTTFNNSGAATFTVTSNATNANTGGTIVARDGSGNFSAGTITASLSGNASSATALQTARTFEITGDIVGSPISFDGTGNISIAATIQPNSVALGDDTTGNYVATISGTTGEIEVSGSGSESAAVTIGLPNIINVGGVNASGISTFQGNVYLGDNDKINFGDSDDLQIYHDGTHSWIWEQGPGNLYLRSNGGSINLRLNSTDMVVVNEGGSVDLYHNTSKKIETTTTGITVTGTAVATTFSGSGASLTSIPNTALDNSTVSYGGVTLSLGGTDATPAFDLQDATGLPISTGVAGLGANVATFLATPSSSNLAAAVTDETGTGALVFATSPTLVTPVLGAASATSVTASGIVTATRFVSTQSTGTAPFTVSSTTVVTNLNADTVDGLQASQLLRSDATDDFTGVLQGNNPGGTYLNLRGGGGSNTLLMRVSAAELDENISSNLSSDYGFNIRYRGDLSGVENALQIDADNQAGTAIEALRIKQNGVVYFGPNPYVGANRILTTADEGSGNGLDADTVDGLNPSSSNTASTIVSRDASGNFSAGAITANSYNVGVDAGISTTRTTVATTSATTIDSFAVATYRSARVQVQITQGTNYQASDVLIIHNGSTADVVEYGSIATNDYLGTFSATISGGNCLLRINMISATSATVKVLSQRITV